MTPQATIISRPMQERPHLGHAQRSVARGLAQRRRHLGRFPGRLQRRAHAAGRRGWGRGPDQGEELASGKHTKTIENHDF